MIRILIDDGLPAKIPLLHETTELCDETGKVVGQLYPYPVSPPTMDAGIGESHPALGPTGGDVSV